MRQVSPACTVAQLADRTAQELGCTTRRHSLFLHHLALQVPASTYRPHTGEAHIPLNSQAVETLAAYKIADGSTLQLILLPTPEMQSGGARRATERGDRIRVAGEPGSLYQRCGGIWGVSGPIDVPTD